MMSDANDAPIGYAATADAAGWRVTLVRAGSTDCAQSVDGAANANAPSDNTVAI